MHVMPAKLSYAVNAVLRRAPGWLLILGGVALVAIAVLAPAYRQCQRMTWQKRSMQRHAAELARLKAAYADTEIAMADHDPILLGRLAFRYMHMKPLQSLVLSDIRRDTLDPRHVVPAELAALGLEPVHAPQHADHRPNYATPTPSSQITALGRYPPMPETRSYLVTLTTGVNRLIALAVGVLYVFAGLTFDGRPRAEPEHTRSRDTGSTQHAPRPAVTQVSATDPPG